MRQRWGNKRKIDREPPSLDSGREWSNAVACKFVIVVPRHQQFSARVLFTTFSTDLMGFHRLSRVLSFQTYQIFGKEKQGERKKRSAATQQHRVEIYTSYSTFMYSTPVPPKRKAILPFFEIFSFCWWWDVFLLTLSGTRQKPQCFVMF